STPPLSFSDSGAHGKVTVEATVDKSGSVIATKVVQNTTGSEALGKAAEKEIRLARFDPPIRKCVPVKFIYVYRRDY
ncbi:MAG TPA: energy transducer TonB, partial [Thermoanaerobaculia bacterium]